jgi:death-on-curing protein
LYPSIEEKAAILGFLIIMGHPFIDGNKRTAHAAMEVFLVLNGFALEADTLEAEALFLGLAAGKRTKDDLIRWIQEHLFQLHQL